MTGASAPLLVEVTRGNRVESRHEVDVVVVDASGAVVRSWGDPTCPVLPRSAVKPLQALPLVATGAADAFGLGDVELALACASHDGEPAHVAAVESWLDRIGLAVDHLACGAHPPLHQRSAADLAVSGVDPTDAHNNCSGKHAGFLTVCQHLGLPVEGYLRPDHPLQAAHVTPALAEACRFDLSGQAPGVDGCGIPVWSLPLDRLAAGWVGLGVNASRNVGGVAARLLAAMRSERFHVAGSTRACTRLIGACTGGTVVKTGAEGVFCAVVSDDGLGLALKVRDGAGRAADAAVEWLLASLGRYDGPIGRILVNRAGIQVGEVRVAGDGTAFGSP
ncbi:MAG: asparaginase [Actinomycetota bacterium]|nr:asparaginase [Actinomycetota bacterium]